MAMDKIKPLFKFLVVLFLLYAVFSAPQESAAVVKEIWHIISTGLSNLMHFFNALLGKE